MQKNNQERLYEVIRSPLITEKTTLLSSNNQVVFEVCSSATKHEIRDALKLLFKVDVEKVATVNQKGKQKVFRGRIGFRKDTKKAIVTLKDGQNIDLSTGV
jgi:large subunit ribosomal protein L23